MNLPHGLTVVESGRGPAVVLVHGALGDYRQWAPIGERLQPHHCVVAVSRRYHWPNDLPSLDVLYSYESHRDDLLEWLHSRNERVHLAGHSYGAGVALVAALSEPKRLRSLTLIEPAFGSVVSNTAPELEPELASRNATMATVKSLVKAGDNEGAAETLFDWFQAGTGGFSRLPEDVREGIRANAPTIGPTFAVTARNITCDQLKGLRVPTLVLNGEHTRLWYRLIGQAVVSCIPGAEAAVIAGASHMVIVENPRETADRMLAFFARH